MQYLAKKWRSSNAGIFFLNNQKSKFWSYFDAIIELFSSHQRDVISKGSFTNFKSIATGYYSKYFKNLRNAVSVLNIKKCRDE